MYYNVRAKEFLDGTVQLSCYKNCRERDFPVSTAPVRDGSSVQRKKIDNSKRARNMVYDIARSNTWDWFLTITFDGQKVDRYDFDAVVASLGAFTKALRRAGCQWLFVPEQHRDGAWHFHGLISGDLPVIRAVHPQSGRPLFDRKGNEIYNACIYKLGFSTVTRIKNQARVATYITKYISKSDDVPAGRKRYWASRGLARPDVSYYWMFDHDVEKCTSNPTYEKMIENPYCPVLLVELDINVRMCYDVIILKYGGGSDGQRTFSDCGDAHLSYAR